MLGALMTAGIRPRARRLMAAACGLLLMWESSGDMLAQQLPSADELRSMYCIEVLRAEIGLQRRMISASDVAAGGATSLAQRQEWIDTSAELLHGLQRLELLRYRLQSYMLPRIAALDSFSLADALRRGAADFQASSTVADLDCGMSCGGKASLDRVSGCDKPSWLPP